MGSRQSQTLVFTGIRGRSAWAGRALPEHGGPPMTTAREAVNVLLDGVWFAEKRDGSSAVDVTFSSGGPFSGLFRAFFRASSGELFAVDSTGQFAFLALAATQWAEITVADAVTAPTTADIRFAQMRSGSIAVTYPNSANRMHVITTAGVMRRMGMGTPAAPTGADLAGSGGVVPRYYRVRMGVLSGSTVLRMGEAGASLSFTPVSGGATVTKPATIEDATHWRVEVSLDDAVWYVLSGWIAVGTTTYADTVATTTYSTNDAAPLAGRYTNWTVQKVLTTDETRLIGSTAAGRVSFSPVRGTTSDDFLDEEFVPNTVEQKNWLTLDGDGSDVTAISPPFQGSIWVHRRHEIARLVPTHLDTAPFRVVWLIRDAYIGAIRQEGLIMATDEAGHPAMYWWAQDSIYRYGAAGLQHLSEDVSDYVGGTADGVHGVFWESESVILWFGGAQTITPSTVALVFHTKLGRVERPGYVRDGWSTWTGDIASTTASVMYGSAAAGPGGVGTESTYLRPVVGYYPQLGGTAKLLMNGFADDDDGTDFQSYVSLPARSYAGIDHACRVTGAAVLGYTGTITLRLTLTPDFGAMTARTADVSMAAVGSELVATRVFEAAEMDDHASAIQIQIGDAAASEQWWVIFELRVRIERGVELMP